MRSTVIGGAMLPHAPQFFTLPDTEDKKTVEQVRTVAADIGKKLKALKPDLWIIFSNDHAEQFFHNAAPPFTIHVGGEASGEFAGRKFHWNIPSEVSFARNRHPGERRHVAFPRHRSILQSGISLGQQSFGEACGRQSEISDRL
jgi:hypothetical protein